LVGTDTDLIIKKATEYLDTMPEFKNCVNPYGDGKASQKISTFIKSLTQK
jgi:UDP-N-acetylglucosamine 2-epimerase